jgi:hypothetical protein
VAEEKAQVAEEKAQVEEGFRRKQVLEPAGAQLVTSAVAGVRKGDSLLNRSTDGEEVKNWFRRYVAKSSIRALHTFTNGLAWKT